MWINLLWIRFKTNNLRILLEKGCSFLYRPNIKTVFVKCILFKTMRPYSSWWWILGIQGPIISLNNYNYANRK